MNDTKVQRSHRLHIQIHQVFTDEWMKQFAENISPSHMKTMY